MPKKCDTPVQLPLNSDCSYRVDEIQGKECLSDSLEIINNNFFVVDEASCEVTPEVYKRLKVKTEYTQPLLGTGQAELLPNDTFVLNFSGEGVNVTENGTLKTVSIPITGVVGIVPGRNVTVQATGLTNDGDIAGPMRPLPQGGIAQGDVLINAILPDSPRQVRTFFYYGPTPATNPGTKNKVNITGNLPTINVIQNFVNNQLNIPSIDNQDPLFNGGDVYVVYQINGLLTYQAQAALTYSISFSYDWKIKIIGNPPAGARETFSSDSFAQASRSSNPDMSSTSLTNLIVYFLSRDKGQSNYTVKRTFPLQNLSQANSSGSWLTPQTWGQY